MHHHYFLLSGQKANKPNFSVDITSFKLTSNDPVRSNVAEGLSLDMKRTAAALRAVWGLALAAAVASDEAHRREDSMMGDGNYL